MSSTASCEVCGAPALARVGGVQFCARCALQIDTGAPIPRRRAGRRWARLVAGVGAGLVLAVGGIAAAAYWANTPSGRITQTEPIVAEGSAGAATAPEVLHANRLSAAAADYAESVATWALCVTRASYRGLEPALVLEFCASLQPASLDPSEYEEGSPSEPIMATAPLPRSAGHVLEGLDESPTPFKPLPPPTDQDASETTPVETAPGEPPPERSPVATPPSSPAESADEAPEPVPVEDDATDDVPGDDDEGRDGDDEGGDWDDESGDGDDEGGDGDDGDDDDDDDDDEDDDDDDDD